ncbi:MAG: hypothetical protein KGJ06_04695 [Pseudomonadota bacterium]|nr:hypothetical protein [Pseudomonadota bacterium]
MPPLLRQLEDNVRSGENVQHCLEKFLPLQPAEAAKPAELSFIPAHAENLHFMMAAKATIAMRIQQGWYKNRLIVLPTLEKSGSTFCELMLSDMLLRNGVNAKYFPASGSAGPLSTSGPAHFSCLGLMNIPDGGVLRGSFEPEDRNLDTLQKLGCPVVILMRHPADRLVANICMRYKLVSDQFRKPLAQVIDEIFFGLGNAQARTKAEGYLPDYFETLQWMSGWLALAGRHNFIVVRYEDLFYDAARAIPALYRRLFDGEMGAGALDAAIALQQRTHEGGDLQASKANPHYHYPHSYTGKAGVWRDYLNSEHVATANRITEAFCAINSHAESLLRLYPDLMLDSSELTKEKAASA